MSKESFWSEERVEQARKMWMDGESATRIAKALHAVSRNAVISIAHRRNFPTRAAVDMSRTHNRVQSMAANERKPPDYSRPRKAKPGMPAVGGAKKAINRTKNLPAVLPPTKPPPREVGVSLLELSDQTCKWPIGDPASPDFYFCGGAPNGQQPYCAYHASLAYQSVADRRSESRAHWLRTKGMA